MHHATLQKRAFRTWSAMLAALPDCFGCGKTLPNTVSCLDGFCTECLERSRSTTRDELGGEA